MFLKKIFLLFFILNVFSVVYGQEKSPQKKLEALESRILILEDFLKSRLNHLQKNLKDQETIMARQQEENLRMQKELQSYKEKTQRMEEEILNLKAMFSSLTKTEQMPVSPTVEDKKVEDTEGKKSPVPSYYEDKEISLWAEKLQSPISSIRMNAILNLSKSEKQEADLLLVKALEDQDRYIKMLSLKALVKRKSRIAVYPLLSLLEKEKADMASLFLDALQSITKISEPFPLHASETERQTAVQRWKEKLQQAGF